MTAARADGAADTAADTAADLLNLAATLPRDAADRLAHALGWPDTYQIRGKGHLGRIKWANPYRRHYVANGGPDDPEWRDVRAAGLASPQDGGRMRPDMTIWTVTARGQAVIRVRLQAEILAARGQADGGADE